MDCNVNIIEQHNSHKHQIHYWIGTEHAYSDITVKYSSRSAVVDSRFIKREYQDNENQEFEKVSLTRSIRRDIAGVGLRRQPASRFCNQDAAKSGCAEHLRNWLFRSDHVGQIAAQRAPGKPGNLQRLPLICRLAASARQLKLAGLQLRHCE
jgi:hypothetical protein